ncbi:hypothetical protein BU24DRAFT_3892 [Aaosphaeria arxii CBS 175.79]|uniref:Uncharacterized protein n=1 Tax=Aaosphaeria arxii CBS 175.79 TaxID=1450172 RepID=A0A6A5Y5N8_9PLEO|nr:uncharacterized protein BU24DRAFT_3892 [Aaosphaeria arxii CBS 175.79]KAF2020606.1 hypothetical protein BU24DRAFT_3892 [Aaosphaeria arxii CBS 175.79]
MVPTTEPLQHPMMLDDLKHNFQSIAATLPPDGWEEPGPPSLYIHREDSGMLTLIDSRDDTASEPFQRNHPDVPFLTSAGEDEANVQETATLLGADEPARDSTSTVLDKRPRTFWRRLFTERLKRIVALVRLLFARIRISRLTMWAFNRARGQSSRGIP